MLYIDCSRGIAGDMFVGALVDLGADYTKIVNALKPVARVRFRKVSKRGVLATKFDVTYKPASREYRDLLEEINKLRVSLKVKSLARRILTTLASAEASVHNVPLKKVRLHEAVDCVVDSVAVALALEDLNLIDARIKASVLSVGCVAPATEWIIKQHRIPVRVTSSREVTTPTGAAILASLAAEYTTAGVEGNPGFGAGSMNLGYPNVLKIVLTQELVLLESNIDDSTPECLSYAVERLIDEGALDVHLLPCFMKKGRIGFLVRVLTASPEKHAAVLMEETSTLGVRVLPVVGRFEAQRSVSEKTAVFNKKTESVRVKKSAFTSKPEFEDVRRIAKKHGIPFNKVAKRFAK